MIVATIVEAGSSPYPHIPRRPIVNAQARTLGTSAKIERTTDRRNAAINTKATAPAIAKQRSWLRSRAVIMSRYMGMEPVMEYDQPSGISVSR